MVSYTMAVYFSFRKHCIDLLTGNTRKKSLCCNVLSHIDKTDLETELNSEIEY